MLEGRKLTKPVIYKDKIIIGDDDGNLHFISQKSGELIDIYKFGDNGITASPIVEKGLIYILGRKGKVVALSAS